MEHVNTPIGLLVIVVVLPKLWPSPQREHDLPVWVVPVPVEHNGTTLPVQSLSMLTVRHTPDLELLACRILLVVAFSPTIQL